MAEIEDKITAEELKKSIIASLEWGIKRINGEVEGHEDFWERLEELKKLAEAE